MADAVQWRLDLEIDPDSIRGSTCDPEGRRSSFSGWLGLIALVARAQAQLGAGPAESPGAPDDPGQPPQKGFS